jgi:acetyltransferase-like isoleucine patch superfamily enzyme
VHPAAGHRNACGVEAERHLFDDVDGRRHTPGVVGRATGNSTAGWRRQVRLVVLILLSPLPSFAKRPLYRLLLGYRLGRRVWIGLSVLDAQTVDLAEGTCIGHFNVITRVGRLETGLHARIGMLNVIRGGERVSLGDYSEVMRLNVLNAIPDHDCTTEPESVLDVGAGAVITSGHRIDFTDKVSLGKNVIVGGRNSSLWTHNRQETAPIEIGDFCYLGSEVRLAPGAKLPKECVLGLGSVLTGEITEPRSLVAGVPAKVVRPLNERDLARIRRKTRADMPDGYYEIP